MNEKAKSTKTDISFSQLAMSVFAAFFGVQSNANRERDFKNGKLSHFILLGLIFGILFILIIVSVVTLVMKMTGA